MDGCDIFRTTDAYLQARLETATLAFVGTVAHVEDRCTFWERDVDLEVTFQVTEAFEGVAVGESVTLIWDDGRNCKEQVYPYGEWVIVTDRLDAYDPVCDSVGHESEYWTADQLELVRAWYAGEWGDTGG